jgi:hypothetical protein
MTLLLAGINKILAVIKALLSFLHFSPKNKKTAATMTAV